MLIGTGAVQAQSSRGELTVTATVVASVGVEIGPDGNQTLIVANSADPQDNVSLLVAAESQPAQTEKPKKPAKKAGHSK